MNRTDSLRDVSDNEDSSADTQKISGVQQFIGRFRLQTVLIISLVIVVVLAMGITGFLSFFNGQLAVNDMANQVQNQVSDRIFFIFIPIWMFLIISTVFVLIVFIVGRYLSGIIRLFKTIFRE
ncbi:hypothetical protein ACKUB1_12510 [Methanospirillum stamsii]|uniref:DUF3566 domain-containing protein n=1 Tax=Methanospirillum stamsii TaxID=1277351 RepID=A0A2V2NFL4_9EURY|nr:hypothetical protein [Methanospirillum stamsii]PWR76346.1 hypothetical protein DLD82_00625 [Methanospirillum stamsii]